MIKVSFSLLSSLLCLVPMVQIGRCDEVQPPAGTQQAGETQVVNPPNLAETKAIAEEAYIYGLPIVMNYASPHENQ